MKTVKFNVRINARFPIATLTEPWTIRFGTDSRQRTIVFLKPESAKRARPISLEALPLFLGKIHRQLKAQKVKIAAAILMLCAVVSAQADDHRKVKRERHESHNYIIERQTAGQVSGVPTSRRIIGKREIDVYSNGLMFEKNNVVGVKK
jgi:hypothetical protein